MDKSSLQQVEWRLVLGIFRKRKKLLLFSFVVLAVISFFFGFFKPTQYNFLSQLTPAYYVMAGELNYLDAPQSTVDELNNVLLLQAERQYARAKGINSPFTANIQAVLPRDLNAQTSINNPKQAQELDNLHPLTGVVFIKQEGLLQAGKKFTELMTYVEQAWHAYEAPRIQLAQEKLGNELKAVQLQIQSINENIQQSKQELPQFEAALKTQSDDSHSFVQSSSQNRSRDLSAATNVAAYTATTNFNLLERSLNELNQDSMRQQQALADALLKQQQLQLAIKSLTASKFSKDVFVRPVRTKLSRSELLILLLCVSLVLSVAIVLGYELFSEG